MKNFLKVLASYLFLILLTIAILDFFLTPKIIHIVTNRIENEMFSIAKVISFMPGDQLEKRLSEVSGQTSLRVTLIDASGKVIADSHTDLRRMENHLNRPEIQQAQREGQGKSARFSTTRRENMLYIALPVKRNGEITGYIRLARPLVEVEKSLQSLYSVIYLTMFIILLPSIVLAIVFSKNFVFKPSPVEKALEKNLSRHE